MTKNVNTPKINVKLKKEDNAYVRVKVKDLNGKSKYVDMHGYLVGMEAALALKKKEKFCNLVIITGSIGSGKSTLVKGLGALGQEALKDKLTFDNFSWATEKFIEKTDKEDNVGTDQIWDESIQGATGRNMAITAVGNKLKTAFVTKRFKRHTYYLLIDEINEYAWKLIKMCDCWINVRKFYLKRGYFECYTNPYKIKLIYNSFKYYGKTWHSPEVKRVSPDNRGKFNDWSNLFVDEEEYDKLKLEETQQLEVEDKIKWSLKKVKAFYLWAKNPKQKNVDLAKDVDVHKVTMGEWIKEFKKVIK